MKKTILILKMLLVSVISFAQSSNSSPSPYHNLIVNENVHFQGDSTNSCYVVISDVSINSLKDLSAMYMVRVYKTKAIYQQNEQWYIPTAEITTTRVQFTAEFTQGDLFLKITNELKTALLKINPTWKASNIVVETEIGQ